MADVHFAQSETIIFVPDNRNTRAGSHNFQISKPVLVAEARHRLNSSKGTAAETRSLSLILVDSERAGSFSLRENLDRRIPNNRAMIDEVGHA